MTHIKLEMKILSVQDAKPTGQDFLAEQTLQKGTLVNLETLLIPIFLIQ